MLVLTGARRSEISDMRWTEIDFAARIWLLPAARSKNGQEHTVPLSPAAIEVLKGLAHNDGDLVFSLNGETSISSFHKIKRRLDALMPADMPAWVFHDIRRSVAGNMAALGISLPVIEKVLNHQSGSFKGIVKVYQRHSLSDEKREALECWTAHIERLASGEPAPENIVPMRHAI